MGLFSWFKPRKKKIHDQTLIEPKATISDLCKEAKGLSKRFKVFDQPTDEISN